MTMPSPFAIGQQTSQNVRQGLSQYREGDMLDNILQQAQASGDPRQVDNIMNQIITRVSPEQRPAVMEALKTRKQQLQNQKTQNEMTQIANQIEMNNPNSSFHKMLADVYRSNIPIDQKEKLIKSLSGAMPFKREQQERLKFDSVLKRYNSRIKEIDSSMKIPGTRLPERKKLKKQKDALVKERDNLLDFKALEEPKPAFDKNNPEHIKIRDQILIEAGNDKNKANAILSEIFD